MSLSCCRSNGAGCGLLSPKSASWLDKGRPSRTGTSALGLCLRPDVPLLLLPTGHPPAHRLVPRGPSAPSSLPSSSVMSGTMRAPRPPPQSSSNTAAVPSSPAPSDPLSITRSCAASGLNPPPSGPRTDVLPHRCLLRSQPPPRPQPLCFHGAKLTVTFPVSGGQANVPTTFRLPPRSVPQPETFQGRKAWAVSHKRPSAFP